MENNMIYGSTATLEDLVALNELGFEFVINNGEITEVIHE